jgi:hypothetical protein
VKVGMLNGLVYDGEASTVTDSAAA